jgi:hypothetical protein
MDINQTIPEDDKTEISDSDKKRRSFIIIFCAILVLSLIIGWSPINQLSAMPLQETLTDRTMQVIALIGITIVAGAAVDAIPFGNGIDQLAAKLFDVAGYLMVVLGALIAMQILLTLSLSLSFGIFIPGACLLALWSIIKRHEVLMVISKKLVIFALVFAFAIPASVGISLMIDNTFEAQRANLMEDINAMNIDIQIVNDEIQSVTEELEELESDSANRNFLSRPREIFDGIVSYIRDIPANIRDTLSSIGDTISTLPDRISAILQNLILIVVQWIITVCVVPIVTLIGFGVVIKILFGFDVNQKLATAAKTIHSKTSSTIMKGSKKLSHTSTTP